MALPRQEMIYGRQPSKNSSKKAVLDFVRMVWDTGEIPQAWADVPVVTIPKKSGGWRMIALDACTHKVLSSIINSRLEQYPLHGAQFRFVNHRGTTMPILGLKLLIQQARREGRRLFVAFVDIKEAYYSVSRTAMWAVLERAGINGRIRSLLVSAFEKERLSVSVGGRCGPLFRSERGVKAGDSVSPRLFNLVLDAVIRQVSPVCKSLFFYADDGALVASDEQQLQLALDTLVTSLAPFGWEVSASKTKVACFQPAIAHVHVAENAYQGAYLHKPDENYQKFSTKWSEKVRCATCGTMVRLGGLKEHRRTKTVLDHCSTTARSGANGRGGCVCAICAGSAKRRGR